MRDPTIARNYAEALLAAGRANHAIEAYGDLLQALAGALEAEPSLQLALNTPRVPKDAKVALVTSALEHVAPAPFVRFVAAVIRRGRQNLFSAIREQYQGLVDIELDRVHANVTVAREADAELKQHVTALLTEVLGKEVVPHFRTDERLLGGVVIRVGDRVYDGSIRRKLRTLRRAMLA